MKTLFLSICAVSLFVSSAFTLKRDNVAPVVDLTGTYEIYVKGDNRFLGWDEKDKLISTRDQNGCSDNKRFILFLEPDGAYTILVLGSSGKWHVDSSKDRLLSTRFQVNDDHTRFFFEPQSDGSYRIKLKATGRYLHEDGSNDKLVSTRFQVNDDFTRFVLVKNSSTPFNRTIKNAEDKVVLTYSYRRPISGECSIPQSVKDADFGGGLDFYINLFSSACNEHDFNYQAPWRAAGFDGYKGKEISDARFRKEMYTICETKIKNDIIGLATFNCKRMADVWFLAVNQTQQGRTAFDEGQNKVDCNIIVK